MRIELVPRSYNHVVTNTELLDDMGLKLMIEKMALGDETVYETIEEILEKPIFDVKVLKERKVAVKDALNNPEIVRELYRTVSDALERKKKEYLGVFGVYPSSIVYSSVKIMNSLIDHLEKLRRISQNHRERFESRAFLRFFESMVSSFSEGTMNELRNHLREIEFPNGISLRAGFGLGLSIENLKVIRSRKKRNILDRFFKRERITSFTINGGDEAGTRAISEMKERGLTDLANALRRMAEYIERFFENLKRELAFYVGILNLADFLRESSLPISLPEFTTDDHLYFEDLYYPILAILGKRNIVSNSLNLPGRSLTIVTGANRGGKTTFLRSLGIAQIMAQSGIFVPARSFKMVLYRGIFSHFRGDEDEGTGKLEEELRRMRDIVDELSGSDLILMNESFSSTSEREGSEIANQIVRALKDSGEGIVYVTHLTTFTKSICSNDDTLCLKAERLKDGTRTYKMIVSPPTDTSHAMDVFRRVFHLFPETL